MNRVRVEHKIRRVVSSLRAEVAPAVRPQVTQAVRLLLMTAGPSLVHGNADRFVSRWAELEPTGALVSGLAGTPGRLSDWSPEGRARVADALRQG